MPSRARFIVVSACAVPLFGLRAGESQEPHDPRLPFRPFQPHIPAPIPAAPTSIAAFVGTTRTGPKNLATAVTSLAAFEAIFNTTTTTTTNATTNTNSTPASPSNLATMVSDFFSNGGTNAYIVRLETPNDIGSEEKKTGIHALDAIPAFNILVAPAAHATESDENARVRRPFARALATYAAKRGAMYLAEAPPAWTSAANRGAVSEISTSEDLFDVDVDAATAAPFLANCVVYLGRIGISGSTTTPYRSPNGAIAGLWARNDANVGVWKAPAGMNASLTSAARTDIVLDDARTSALSQLGINALRVLPATQSVLVWGARTLAQTTVPEALYVPVRRFMIFVEQSIAAGSRWTVFEPNAPPTWADLSASIEAFLLGLFRQGALQGTTPQSAFFVKCDATTMTATQIAAGQLICTVGVAPLYPAEFVVIQIALIANPP